MYQFIEKKSTSWYIHIKNCFQNKKAKVIQVSKLLKFVINRVTYLFVKKVDREINGVNARIYKPASLTNTAAAPIIIYYHGGGYILGTFGTLTKLDQT